MKEREVGGREIELPRLKTVGKFKPKGLTMFA